jgi:hypothetical protein
LGVPGRNPPPLHFDLRRTKGGRGRRGCHGAACSVLEGDALSLPTGRGGGVAGREAAFTRRPFLTGAGALRGARDVTLYEAAQYQLSVLFRAGSGGDWGAARPAGCIWRGPLDRTRARPRRSHFLANISSYRRCAHLGFPAASSSSTLARTAALPCIWNPVHLGRIGQIGTYWYVPVRTSTTRYKAVREFHGRTYRHVPVHTSLGGVEVLLSRVNGPALRIR